VASRFPNECPNAMIEGTTREGRLFRRRAERRTILPLTALDQLGAGVSIFYSDDGLDVEELSDGSRYVVELVDGGRSARRLREF